MGSEPRSRVLQRRGPSAGRSLSALPCLALGALGALLLPAPHAAAQTIADAGATPGAAPAPSPFFPKLIRNPGALSEKTRARLMERHVRAAEHASHSPQAPVVPSAPLAPPSPEAMAVAHEPHPSDARMRRMISYETDGVTILSNRPHDAPASLATKSRRALSDDSEAQEDPASVRTGATELRPLRPRPTRIKPRSEEARSIWPWLVIPSAGVLGLALWWVRRGRAGSA